MAPFKAPFKQPQPQPQSQPQPQIQTQMQPTNNPAPQHMFVQSNPCNTGTNHQFPPTNNGQYPPSSSNASNATHFPNVHNQCLPMQNSFVGQFYPQNTLNGHHLNQIPISQPNGQQWFLNNQAPFQIPPMHFTFPQNFNQIATGSFSSGHFTQHPQVLPFNIPSSSHPFNQGPQNQISQNPKFFVNPHYAGNLQNSNQQMFGPPNMVHQQQIAQNTPNQQMLGPPNMVHQQQIAQNTPNQQMLGPPNMGHQQQIAQNTQNQQMLGPPNMGNQQHIAQNTQNQQMVGPPSMGHQQHLQMPSHPSFTSGSVQMQQPQMTLQPGTFQRGDHVSNINKRNHQSNNSTKNHHDSVKRESTNPRFQIAKSKVGLFGGKGGKGLPHKRAKKPKPADFKMKIKGEPRRPLFFSYSEKEIQEWREERRKNHPSKPIEKKVDENQIHSDAQKRRQQLKKILAKQAELGVEVAELPANYLSDSGNQIDKPQENRKRRSKKGRFTNKNGRRQMRGGKGNQFGKKQKLGESGATEKKLSLLQKLMSADIKRDKSHLLQAFRFMVVNSFFKDWPEKHLKLPSIRVKDVEVVKISSPCHAAAEVVLSSIREDAKTKDFEDVNYQHVATDGDEDDVNEDGDGDRDRDEADGNEGESSSESSEEEEGEIAED